MKLWTVKEISRLIGVNEITVRRAIKAGRLESRKVGGSRRVRHDWLVAWLGFDPLNPASSTHQSAGSE